MRELKFRVLKNIGSEYHQTSGEERQMIKGYLRRTRKFLETRLCSRNLIKTIKTRVVAPCKVFRAITEKKELRQFDRRTRKLVTMHMALHPKDDYPVDWGVAVEYTDCFSAEGVRPPQWVSWHDSKQSDGEVPMMLKLWGLRSTPSLSSLPGPLWPGMVAPDKGPIYGLNRIIPWFLEFTVLCI